jgi:hypothetical protein
MELEEIDNAFLPGVPTANVLILTQSNPYPHLQHCVTRNAIMIADVTTGFCGTVGAALAVCATQTMIWSQRAPGRRPSARPAHSINSPRYSRILSPLFISVIVLFSTLTRAFERVCLCFHSRRVPVNKKMFPILEFT